MTHWTTGGDDARVTFADGSREVFDIVIAADGMDSRARKPILGDGDRTRYLGCWSSYFTIPRLERDNDWWRWCTSPTGVVAFQRPRRPGHDAGLGDLPVRRGRPAAHVAGP